MALPESVRYQFYMIFDKFEVQFIQIMPKDSEFPPFSAPDISRVDPTKTTKFTNTAPDYRTIHKGFNMQGKCMNTECEAYKKKVWTPLGYGTFSIAEWIKNCKCPSCTKCTKGNKMFGLYKAELTGYGMKKPKQIQSTGSTNEQTDDQQSELDFEDQKVVFDKIINNTGDAFLKMDGNNGPLIKWCYMTLTIEQLS